MSGIPSTPPSQARSQYYPHSDTPTAADASPQPTSKRSGRKPKASTPLRYDSDHVSDNPAIASPSKTHASRATRPSTSTVRKQKHQPSTAPVQIPQVDGTLSPRATPARPSTAYAATPTPMKAAAYAGPTFHASPAASALPLPKFFSKSVPAPNHGSGLQAKFDAEVDGANGTPELEKPALQPPLPSPHITREESPLDMFFNAHRAERARESSIASSHLAKPTNPSAAPPLLSSRDASDSPYQHLPPRDSPRPWQTPSTPSGKDMFMMELDGAGEIDESDDAPPSVPFKDRIQLAKSASKVQASPSLPHDYNRSTPRPSQPDQDDLWRQKQSLALKKLLGTQPQAASPLGQSQERHHYRQQSAPHYSTGGPGYQNGSTPIQQQENCPRTDVKSMEKDLRRMLKLDP